MASSILHLGFFAIYMIQTGFGFNIDVRFPVMKEGKTKGSFFGFSVAQHRQTEKTKKYLLLAGAPKEKALSQFRVNETGAIYSCPITTQLDDCTRVDFITSMDSFEMIEDMWLGVTVASQRLRGGRVLACGHRYVKIVRGGTEEQRRMVGKCFVRGNDLTYNQDDDWQTHTYEVCNPNFDMELEGMCNMGISAGITDTDVYIGCTGSFEWQGNVHVTWRDTTPGNSWDYTESAFRPQGRRNSYMGYSVTEDRKLLSKENYTVVTGAPRDESRGSVTLATKGQSILKAIITIQGEQVGSYFGSSIAVADLNNDDWNDLLVGAPFYFDRYKEHEGAVYIFMNENGSFQNKANMVLKGVKGSAFGFAVAAVGDVNQDGFQDFAVGAPFHDSGRVYIWMGSQKGITVDPSQVIEGRSVGSGKFSTFGYSISGGMDMDGNQYPDILVGSLDDCIALLRARPVIHLSQNFTVEPKIVDPSQCKNPCVTVKICFGYTLSSGKRGFKNSITVNYTIEADRGRRSARVQFPGSKLSTFTGLMSFSSPACQELGLTVSEQLRNKLEPIVFLLNVSLHEQEPSSPQTLQNLDAFPVLSAQQRLTEKAEINFQKECGSDNKCSSNLQLKAQFVNEQQTPFPSQGGGQTMEYNTNIKKLLLMVEVTNLPEHGREAEDAHQAMLNITIPTALKYSGWRSQDIVCSAHTTINCDLGNPFKSNKRVSFLIIFETFITLYTEQIELQVQLSTLSEQSDLYPVPVVLTVENKVLTSFSIDMRKVTTSFSGRVVGESGMRTTGDVGSLVEFAFQVSVEGEPLGELGTLVVDFEWPYEVMNGKWLLYLTEILTSGTSRSHCTPPGGVVNTLNLTISARAPKRQRRDSNINLPQTEAAINIFTPRKETYLLECSKRTARCMIFSCPLSNMSTRATVTVRARVWNSTMLEDYFNAFQVIVKGRTTLRLVTDKPAIKMDSSSQEFVVEIDPDLREETPYDAPLWIYMVAGVAGILLLGLISLILWKCGFFKRASRREMYEAKAQKAEMKIQPSETERLTEDY
ncbi:integrin alpha-3b isoform X2 [Electrophorus electricus]|uniref:integrin alpha-3b isoform X2 n=1 Tax=Electrophorus electricus TaxID=8005 RepID=UPI0015CFA9C6|nr:integrin alpha-3b isoform X2 [Electrophorus electricus]